MKLCEKCGAQMPDEAICCTNCGTPLAANQVPNESANQQQPYQQPYQQPLYRPVIDDKTRYMTIAALVLGILSIFCGKFLIGLIFGIAGIVLSVKVRNVIPKGTTERAMATGAMICSIIGVVIGGLALSCAITCGTIGICAACAGAGTELSDYVDWFTVIFR